MFKNEGAPLKEWGFNLVIKSEEKQERGMEKYLFQLRINSGQERKASKILRCNKISTWDNNLSKGLDRSKTSEMTIKTDILRLKKRTV